MSDAYASIAPRYDAEHGRVRDRSGDVAFYAGLARETGGPVLELACGTGRVLLPIAREGMACVGLDASAAMLDGLRAKDPPANLTLVEAPMTSFDLGGPRFGLIYAAFYGFNHLYTVDEQLGALACARRHLAPGGLLAFDVFAPNLALTAIAEQPEVRDIVTSEGEDEIRRFTAVTRDAATQIAELRWRHERWRSGVLVSETKSGTRQRWFYRYELEHLLARAGLEPLAFWGGFDRRPFDGKGEIVVVARA